MSVQFDDLKKQLIKSFEDAGIHIDIKSIKQGCSLSRSRKNSKPRASDSRRFITVDFDIDGMPYGVLMRDHGPISIFARASDIDGIPRSISAFTARSSEDGPYSVSFIPAKLAA